MTPLNGYGWGLLHESKIDVLEIPFVIKSPDCRKPASEKYVGRRDKKAKTK